MKQFRLLASVVSLTLLSSLGSGAHAANLVTNGSFELDSFNSSGSGYSLGLVGGAVTGWFIPASDGVYPWGLQNVNIFNAGPAAAGFQWLVLGEVNTGTQYTIQQTLTGLTPLATYTLGFAIASEQGCCSTAEVSFLSGSGTASQTFNAPNSGSYWTEWGYKSMTFVASNASVTFQFKNLNPSASNGYDLGLDDVSVVGVPEPSTWTLMGLGVAGLVLMRRRAAA